ncbi:unnamed protein product, partial [Rotaria sp. Silwood1]
ALINFDAIDANALGLLTNTNAKTRALALFYADAKEKALRFCYGNANSNGALLIPFGCGH